MEYKGYVIIQAANGHLWIYRNGALVLRVSHSGKKTDEEVRKLVDSVLDQVDTPQGHSVE